MVKSLGSSCQRGLLVIFMLAAAAPISAFPLDPTAMTITNNLSRLVNLAVDPAPRTEETLRQHLSSFAKMPDNPWICLELGLDYLSLASTNRWDYLEKAHQYFRRAKVRLPDHPLVLMNLGRSLGAQALNMDHSVFTRLRWAREGFRYMDHALEKDPSNLFLKLLRAEAALLAHPILRRGGKLTKDANAIQSFVRTNEFEQLTNYQKARFHLFLGNYMTNRKSDVTNGRHHWTAATRLAKNTPVGTEALNRLRGTYVNIGYDGE